MLAFRQSKHRKARRGVDITFQLCIFALTLSYHKALKKNFPFSIDTSLGVGKLLIRLLNKNENYSLLLSHATFLSKMLSVMKRESQVAAYTGTNKSSAKDLLSILPKLILFLSRKCGQQGTRNKMPSMIHPCGKVEGQGIPKKGGLKDQEFVALITSNGRSKSCEDLDSKQNLGGERKEEQKYQATSKFHVPEKDEEKQNDGMDSASTTDSSEDEKTQLKIQQVEIDSKTKATDDDDDDNLSPVEDIIDDPEQYFRA